MEPIIQFKNVDVVYNLGKTNEICALKDINLEIYPEEYVIFFGPSGCGKSTLLYAIAGLEFPTRGKVFVKRQDIGALSSQKLVDFYRSSVGMIFQSFYLISDLSARDNIILPQLFSKTPKIQREKRGQELIQKFDLTAFVGRRPPFLSGGQQQRIAIARALINNPSIVLADEPVGNLDSKNAEIVLGLLSELNQKEKKTIIHVTHDPTYLHCADRIFYIKDGRIVKVVANPEKPTSILSGEKKEEKRTTELERLAMAYPYLAETRLRAKMILNHLLQAYEVEIQQNIEETIEQYLLKKISKEKMFEILDKPPINLYTQTAKNLTTKIDKLVQEIGIIEEVKDSILTAPDERVIALRKYLLDNYSGNFSFEQVQRLEEVLSQRLNGKFQKKDLEKLLDAPLKEGGVGLNKRTARRFAREIELILMK